MKDFALDDLDDPNDIARELADSADYHLLKFGSSKILLDDIPLKGIADFKLESCTPGFAKLAVTLYVVPIDF